MTPARSAGAGRIAGALIAGALSLAACNPLVAAGSGGHSPSKNPKPAAASTPRPTPHPTKAPVKAPGPAPTPSPGPSIPASATSGPTASTSPSPAPTMTPTPSPAPSTAAPALQFGFSAGELVGMSPSDMSAALARYQAAGAGVIRFDLDWANVQPTGPASWDWSAYDALVSALNARHLTALPILDYTPAWARPAGCPSQQCGPANPSAFASFAAAAVSRYSPQGVKLWELWNEQNTTWLPAPSVSAYGRLLSLTSTAVHGADPAATLLVGGLAPAVTTPGGTYSPQDFVAGLYGAGLRSSFDGVAVHPYCFPALPGEGQSWSGWSQMVAVHDVMTANGDGAKSVWATEFGAPTNGPGALATYADRNYTAHPDHVDLDLQARTVDAGIAAARQLPWLKMLLWYSVEDLGTGNATNVTSFGLLNPDGTAKPAYARWQADVRSPAA